MHDTLERCGWEVEVADAQKVEGLGPLACKTDRIGAWVLAELSRRDLLPAIWLPSFELRAERERAQHGRQVLPSADRPPNVHRPWESHCALGAV